MARRAARVIVRAGAEGEAEINKEALDVLARARVSFLDLDGGRELVVPTTPGRGIDLPLAAVDEFGNRFDDDDLPDFSRPAVRTVDSGESGWKTTGSSGGCCSECPWGF